MQSITRSLAIVCHVVVKGKVPTLFVNQSAKYSVSNLVSAMPALIPSCPPPLLCLCPNLQMEQIVGEEKVSLALIGQMHAFPLLCSLKMNVDIPPVKPDE